MVFKLFKFTLHTTPCTVRFSLWGTLLSYLLASWYRSGFLCLSSWPAPPHFRSYICRSWESWEFKGIISTRASDTSVALGRLAGDLAVGSCQVCSGHSLSPLPLPWQPNPFFIWTGGKPSDECRQKLICTPATKGQIVWGISNENVGNYSQTCMGGNWYTCF